MCSNLVPTIIFILLSLYIVSSQIRNNSCPSDDLCIPVRNCTEYMDFIEANRPLNRPLVKFLREQQCGFYKGEPKVCCEYIPDSLKEIISMYNQNPNRLSVRDVRSVTDMKSYSGGRRVMSRKVVDHSRLTFPPVRKIFRMGKRIKIDHNEHIELR